MTDTQFGIQFVVTRNGEPITEVITLINTPIQLHEKHNKATVWDHQMKALSAMVTLALKNVDALRDVEAGTQAVMLAPVQVDGFVKEKLGVPILKVVNRAVLALNKRIVDYNAKRGSDDVG